MVLCELSTYSFLKKVICTGRDSRQGSGRRNDKNNHDQSGSMAMGETNPAHRQHHKRDSSSSSNKENQKSAPKGIVIQGMGNFMEFLPKYINSL